MKRNNRNIIWNSLEAAIVTGGSNNREWAATGVALGIDDIQPGDLFFATKEDNLDMVFEKGAAAVVQTRCAPISDKLPTLSVPSVFEALQALARAARFKSHANILAVQGKKARIEFAETLSSIGTTHEAGRHLSLALAGLPGDVDYGVFGLSPAVQPDIAIITNCISAHRDTLFENMPPHGIAIVDSDDEEFLYIMSRAKAAGVNEVYTFGKSDAADAHLVDSVRADNGVRVSVSLLGELYTIMLPSAFEFENITLAALLTLKLTGKCVNAAVKKRFAHNRASKNLEINGVTLADHTFGGAQAVFRITNMIDLGFGRQTAILDNIAKSADNAVINPKKNLAIPRKLANLDFVYTSKRLSAVSNARAAIKQSHGYRKIETITPDVIAPGDFLVFKDVWDKSKAVLSEALRTVPEKGKRKPKNAI